MDMVSISQNKLKQIKDLYYAKKFSMNQIAKFLGVSIDSVVYFMRRNNLKRRSYSDSNLVKFNFKKPSFKVRSDNFEAKVILTMLYWGEGYKGSKERPADIVDFTNSDPVMIETFLSVLRKLFVLDEKKFRVQIYCYSNQDLDKIVDFWSGLTDISKTQFIKPYVKQMKNVPLKETVYGTVHIRYHDKKLLLEIINLIHCFGRKYARRSYSGNYSRL